MLKILCCLMFDSHQMTQMKPNDTTEESGSPKQMTTDDEKP